jgi:hypothetical protein
MVSNTVSQTYKYYIYLRKSNNYDLCLVLSNFERGVYRGFEFESHLLNPDEFCRMKVWGKQKRFVVEKNTQNPEQKETVLVDDIKYPTIGERILLDDRIFCHKAIINNGPQHISDSEITMFMSEPAKVFRDLCFNIYPPQMSLLDLWSMEIPNTEFQTLL